MQIVILDALTLGEDVDVEQFNRYGKLNVFKTTNAGEISERIKDAEIIITNKVYIGKQEMDLANNLKLICVAATGYNNIDITEARRKNIVVANVRNYSTEGVAQHTFSLILALENSLVDVVNETRAGLWSKSPVFSMLNYPFNEICGKKLGILGYGTIGKRVAEIARAFGMKVLVGKRRGIDYFENSRVDFDVLLRESDILTIHTPLSESTKNLITIDEMRKMKPDALLINVARGGIVNEMDLYQALNEKLIRGAAIDVLENEPVLKDNKLPELKNLLLTPHIAWASHQSRIRLIQGLMSNIQLFINGRGQEINLAI